METGFDKGFAIDVEIIKSKGKKYIHSIHSILSSTFSIKGYIYIFTVQKMRLPKASY